MSAAREFIAAIRAAGLVPANELELDVGRLKRFRVDKDKAGSKNGWYIFHESPVACGAFGSWRTGESHRWSATTRGAETEAERIDRTRLVEAMRQAHAAEKAAVQTSAQQRAAKLWSTAKPATTGHAYLQSKGVKPYGLRQLREMLVVPARDAEGTLHTLQFIGADGSKRFLTGGRIAGSYHSIGRPEKRLLLAEGFATGASLFEATGLATAVCFNCGNLERVARSLRSKFPRLQLVICADDDRATPGNPGMTRAIAAAKAVGGLLAVPRFETA